MRAVQVDYHEIRQLAGFEHPRVDPRVSSSLPGGEVKGLLSMRGRGIGRVRPLEEDRLAFTLQVHGIKIPAEFLGALPYVFAILALVLISSSKRRRATEAPVYLTRPFVREELI